MITVFWLFTAMVGTLGSALFSGMETGTYTLNRIRLHLRVHAHKRNAVLIDRMLKMPNRLLGTLLIGNNIVNYLASYAIAVLLEAAGYRDWAMVVINAALLTPLLLIFGEILPKDLFRKYSDRLVYIFAQPLYILQRFLLYTGMLPLIDLLSTALYRLFGRDKQPHLAPHPRRIVTQLVRDVAGIGVITAYQSNMAERILELEKETAADVMTPWEEVIRVRETDTVHVVREIAEREPYGVLPVVDESDNVVGMLTVFDALVEPDDDHPLTSMIQPIPRISRKQSLRQALTHLQEKKVGIAIVADKGAPIGIVTTKNLVEPVIGEVEIW